MNRNNAHTNGTGSFLSFLLTCLLLLSALCSTGQAIASGRDTHDRQSNAPAPKYLFLFIGDGMGPAQVELAASLLPDSLKLVMTSFPVIGMATTRSTDSFITDSGAAGSALATGFKTANGMISVAPNGIDTLKTLVEMARDKGMRTGIVTSVGIDNATPACFYAHNRNRENYYDISLQMARSGVDYFGGGYSEGDLSAKGMNDRSFKGNIPEVMGRSGYMIATTPSQLASFRPGTRCWTFGAVDSKAALPYEMDRHPGEQDLALFTREGIRLLDNPAGFFMMVEGGKIDWACHANDAAAAARDVQAFDVAIRQAVDFYRKHPAETLIVVTADHECGGLSLGNRVNGHTLRPELLKHQKISSQRLSEKIVAWRHAGIINRAAVFDSLRVWYGLGEHARDPSLALSESEKATLVSRLDESTADAFAKAVTHVLNERAGIGWASNAHTMTPVQVFAMGVSAPAFGGVYDNTAIARKIMQIGRLGNVADCTSRKSSNLKSATRNAIPPWTPPHQKKPRSNP